MFWQNSKGLLSLSSLNEVLLMGVFHILSGDRARLTLTRLFFLSASLTSGPRAAACLFWLYSEEVFRPQICTIKHLKRVSAEVREPGGGRARCLAFVYKVSGLRGVVSGVDGALLRAPVRTSRRLKSASTSSNPQKWGIRCSLA